MDDCTRVLLYGTFDGFTYSTDDLLRITVVLDGGEIVEVPEECIVSADQMVNKYKIRLKDVIERIEKFDLGTKAVWINEILNELGSDYGTLKYKAGYEQGKLEGEWVGRQLKDAEKIRQELNKPVVPQFVADYIKDAKEMGWDLLEVMKEVGYGDINEVRKWFYKDKNMEIFARAWLDGYTVEKEKRYLVKIKGVDSRTNYLYYGVGSKTWLFKTKLIDGNFRKSHTRKQLEIGGFGEVFNNPLFEVEEVE